MTKTDTEQIIKDTNTLIMDQMEAAINAKIGQHQQALISVAYLQQQLQIAQENALRAEGEVKNAKESKALVEGVINPAPAPSDPTPETPVHTPPAPGSEEGAA